MRIQLSGLFRRDLCKKEKRLNLCVPGGKETARMLKALHQELGTPAAPRTAKTPDAAAATAAPTAPPRRDVRAKIRPKRFLSRARCSTNRARPRRPGTSSSISTGTGSTMRRRRLRVVSDQRADARRSGDRGTRRADGFSDRRSDVARRADRRRVAGAAPDMLFQLFSYITGGDRRQKAKALADGGDPDGDAATLDVLAAIAEIPRRAPRSGGASSRRWIRCSRGSIRSPRRPRSTPGASRSPSIPCATTINGRKRLGVASTFLADRVSPATSSRSMCRRRSTSACRPTRRRRSS